MVKFGTVEWAQELKKLIEKDKDMPKLAKGLNTSRVTKVSDKPEIKPVYERMENGKIVEIRLAKPDDAPDFVYTAEWTNWRDMMTGKIDASKALMQHKMSVDGDLTKMQKYMRGYMKMILLMKQIKCEW